MSGDEDRDEGSLVFNEARGKVTDATVEANYFMEVCKEILSEPRFSDEELESSIFFRSTAKRFLEHEGNKNFSNKLEHL